LFHNDHAYTVLANSSVQTRTWVIPAEVPILGSQSFKYSVSVIINFDRNSQLFQVKSNTFSSSKVQHIIFPPSFLELGDNFLQSNSVMKTVIFEGRISNWTSSSLFYSSSAIIDFIVRFRNLVSNQVLDFVGFPETRIGLFFFGELIFEKLFCHTILLIQKIFLFGINSVVEEVTYGKILTKYDNLIPLRTLKTVIENDINVLKDNVLDISCLADNKFVGTNLFYNNIYTLIVGTRNQLPNADDTQSQISTIHFRFSPETTNLIIPGCARLISNLQTLTYDGTIIFANDVLDLCDLQIQ
jgi:hypothetical protein